MLMAIVAAAYGCKDSSTTYSELLKAEKQLITNYIARQHIQILKAEPEVKHGERWGEDEYVAMPSYENFYFHLSSTVDTTAEKLTAGDKINIRYRRYSLDMYADTVSYWTTDDGGDPIVVTLNPLLGDNSTCIAWHMAIDKMGYSGAVCKIICPSTAGFSEDNSSVKPYVYELKATKRK